MLFRLTTLERSFREREKKKKRSEAYNFFFESCYTHKNAPSLRIKYIKKIVGGEKEKKKFLTVRVTL
jgi:hypothetical protein